MQNISTEDIINFIKGEASEELSTAIEAWRKVSESNEAMITKYTNILSAADQLDSFKITDTDKAWDQIDDKIKE